ncbi:hypothetical protein [Streptomyces sp. NPDC048623]|uniref:hypothetical protein n=1 Tax=Streptomyces sp. NPDC048623 TaxID=3155761 RepID=UPI00342ECAAE
MTVLPLEPRVVARGSSGTATTGMVFRLVTNVRAEAVRYAKGGFDIVAIDHAGHAVRGLR